MAHLTETSMTETTLSAFDPEGAALIYWADNLPPGATFDARQNALVWTPDGTAAGRYDMYLHGGQQLWDYAAG